MDYYPGTELLVRICYACGDTIETLEDVWVDVDSNCCIHAQCRVDDEAVPATQFLPDDLNNMIEG